MTERGEPKGNQQRQPNRQEQEQTPEDNPLDLLPETLKERMPPLYSQEHEADPLVICRYFDPVGSWTWYGMEGSPVDEDGYYDTDKEKVDYVFFGYVVGFEPELGYFSLNDLKTAKEGLRGIQAMPIERDIYFRPQRLSEIKRRGCTVNCVTGYALRPTVGGSDDQEHSKT
jgi:Protein of unknown function (DUF2958)